MKKEKIIGVYSWTNKLNGKKYIGVSVDIYKRWSQHTNLSNNGKNRKFYNAIRKHGIDNFDKKILEKYIIFDKKMMKEKEDYYIDLYDTLNNGYNVEKGYNTITDHPNKQDIVDKIREKAKRRRWVNNGISQKTVDIDCIQEYINNGWVNGRLKFTDEHINNLSNSHMGNTLSKETKEKLSKLWKGRKHSEETKENMSKKLKGRYTMEWYVNKYGEVDGIARYKKHHKSMSHCHVGHNKGKVYINNGIKNKMVDKNETQDFVRNGWAIGKIKINKK